MRRFESYAQFISELREYTGFYTCDARTGDAGVTIPYDVVVRGNCDDVRADNGRYVKRDQIDIMHHSYSRIDGNDVNRYESEAKIEAFLDECGIAYERDGATWLDDIQLFVTQYSIEVWYE